MLDASGLITNPCNMDMSKDFGLGAWRQFPALSLALTCHATSLHLRLSGLSN